MSSGYSGTALAKKLGIKNGFTMRIINAPEYYFDLFSDMPEDIHISNNVKVPKDLVHFFTRDMKELAKLLPKLKNEIVQNGIIWVSWPKKAAKIKTGVNENLVRDTGLGCGLVDIKVCAVDEVWSGLKFVIPVLSRKP